MRSPLLQGERRYRLLSWTLMVLALIGLCCEGALILTMIPGSSPQKGTSPEAPSPLEGQLQLVEGLRMSLEERRGEAWPRGDLFALELHQEPLEMVLPLVPPFIQIRGILLSHQGAMALVDVEDWVVGALVREGDTVGAGLKVLKIRSDGVDFLWAGQKLAIDQDR